MTITLWVLIFSIANNALICVLPLFGFVELLPMRGFVIGCDIILTNAMLVAFILLKTPPPK